VDRNTRDFQVEQLTPVRDPVTETITDTVETLYGTDTELSFSSSLSNQWRNSALWGKILYSTEWGENTLDAVLLYNQSNWIGNGQYNTYLNQSFGGNLHYSMAGKYSAGLALTYGGSSVLEKDVRYNLYPAVSLAWKVSEEAWLEGSQAVDALKIRASWGMTGNNLVPQNIYDQRFNMSGNNYYFLANNTGFIGFVEGQLGSPDLKAETSYKSNIGIDAGLFGMMDLNLDLFYDKRKDILAGTNSIVSDVLGVTPPYESLGIVDNKGMELGINVYDNKGDFTFNIGGQFAFVRNEIVEMGEEFRPYDYLKRTGQPVGQYFGLEADGFFSNEADIAASPLQLFSEVRPGDVKYKDQNNDGVIDQNDEIAIGHNSRHPEIYFSGSIALNYKGLGIYALFQGAANRTVYLNTRSVFWPLRGENTLTDFSDDRWTTAGASGASLPRLTMEENPNNYRPNSIWLEDGSYLKLRSLEIYYDLPVELVSQWKLDGVRVYMRGMNLFSLDKVDIADPEAFGVVYPTLTSYNLGLQIGF
jgi:TonB-linked SusC/RagA family outer membrane protein